MRNILNDLISKNAGYFAAIPEELKDLQNDEILEKMPSVVLQCEAHGEFETTPHVVFSGMVKYRECPKCAKERLENEELQKLIALKEREQEAFFKKQNTLLMRGVTQRYLSTKIENNSQIEKLKKHFDTGTNLVILGRCGVGKSFFAYQLVEHYYNKGKVAVVYTANQLRELYECRFYDKAVRKNSFSNIADKLYLDCLIIDEIDDNLAAFAPILRMIASHCDDLMIRMIILGNCDAQYLRDNIDEKTYSRIAREAKAVELGKDGYRDLRKGMQEGIKKPIGYFD